jgi:NAD(P)-dependent dehydrogenase (short-subunit alcohol dehydrogenase family)
MNQSFVQTKPTSARLLENKVTLITGASRGIGAAAARCFAREGATVILAARSRDAMARIVDEIVAEGGVALAIETDVADPASVERLVKRTLDAYGRLDAAFNNAGSGHMPAPLADLSIEDFERNLQVNLGGIFYAMKYEIPAILARGGASMAGGGGAIVNMSSTAGVSGVKGMAAYSAAKYGIIGLTKTAALDYAQLNLRVNVLAPGPVVTERIQSLSDAAREPILQAVPMRRIGLPEEIGSAAAWLCSDRASYITGAVLSIDGGRMAGIA